MLTWERINLTKPVAITLLLVALLAAGNLMGRFIVAGDLGIGVSRLETAIETPGANRTEETKALIAPAIGGTDRAMPLEDDNAGIVSSLEAETLPSFVDRVIKTGSLTLEVKKGRFYRTYDRVVLLAKTYGGHVTGSNSSSGNGAVVSGTISLRVPSENFEKTMAKLRDLGRITGININTMDTSAEFVDLESRLRHWRAQERVLLGLMEKAVNISESITIQQQLAQIQMEIERITGRLNYLKDQTTFSSISLTINEPGAVMTPVDPWGLEATLAMATRAFANTLKGLIVLAGYLAPLALAGGLWLAVRSARRRNT